MGYDLSKEQQRLNEVRLILKDLLKVVKLVAMYPAGNPLPETARRSFAERLTALVKTYGDVKISIGRDTISVGDETVYADSSKEECLASLFFDPGITSITFKEGLESSEIFRFLDVLKEYNNSNRRSDLAAQIWETDLASIGLTTVEDIALAGYEGDFRVAEMFDLTDKRTSHDVQIGLDQFEKYNSIFCALDNAQQAPSDLSESGKLRAGDSQSIKRSADFYAPIPGQDEEVVLDGDDSGGIDIHAAEAVQAMGFGDVAAAPPAIGKTAAPNTTLILNDEFKLSEEEEQRIAGVLIDDAQFDPYESTIELLKEMLLQEVELPAFSETVQTCEKIMNEFVRSGRLAEAGQILNHFRSLEDRLKSERPMWSNRLKDASLMAGSRNRLKSFQEALDQNDAVSAIEMRRYLELLGWEALEGLVDLLGELKHESHRRSLCDYLVIRGKEHLPIIGKGVFDKRWFVVRNAVMILAQIDDDRAVAYLEKAVGHQERRVRLEVLQALRTAVNPKAVKILQRAALDSDAEIRKLALDSLLAQPRSVAFGVMAALVADDRFNGIDKDDQRRILNAYSMLGGKDAVEFLQSLIERRNLWRDGTLSFLRDAAFEALTHNRSQEAEQLLISLGNSWMPGLKQQAQAALKQRRDNIFGGGHERS